MLGQSQLHVQFQKTRSNETHSTQNQLIDWIKFLTNRRTRSAWLTCSLFLYVAVSAMLCKAVHLTAQQESVYTTNSSNSTPAEVYTNRTEAYYQTGTVVTVGCRKGLTGFARATCTEGGAFGVFTPSPHPTCEPGKENAPLYCHVLSEHQTWMTRSDLTMHTIQVFLLQSSEPNEV